MYKNHKTGNIKGKEGQEPPTQFAPPPSRCPATQTTSVAFTAKCAKKPTRARSARGHYQSAPPAPQLPPSPEPDSTPQSLPSPPPPPAPQSPPSPEPGPSRTSRATVDSELSTPATKDDIQKISRQLKAFETSKSSKINHEAMITFNLLTLNSSSLGSSHCSAKSSLAREGSDYVFPAG